MDSVRALLRRHRMPAGVLGAVVAVALLALLPPSRVVATSALGLLLFYGLALLVAALSPAALAWRAVSRRAKLGALALALVSAAFVAWYLSLYDFIPFWDTLQYWTSTLQFNARLDERPYHTVLEALASVNTSDYNDVQCWVFSLPVRLLPGWGQTFFAEFVLISIPVALVGSLACVGFARLATGAARGADLLAPEAAGANAPFLALFAVWLASPVMLRPVLSGYLDEPGVLLFVGAAALAFDPRLVRRPYAGVPLGLSLCAMLVLRRWYAYGIIGLACASVLWWCLRLCACPPRERLASLARVARAFGIVMASAALPLLLFFRGLVLRSVGGNYAEAYASWTWTDSLAARAADVFARLGPCWALLGVVCVAAVLWCAARAGASHEAGRGEALACAAAPICLAVGAATAAVVFWRVQDFSPQHWYMFVPLLLLALGMGMAQAFASLGGDFARAAYAAVTALALATCANGLGFAGTATGVLSGITGVVATTPVVQEGVGERRELVGYLERSVGEGESVYFACASAELNHSTVIGVLSPERPYNPFTCEYADVDSRDGFNTAFFDARWVVCATPYQIHLNDPQDEQVVIRLNDLVKDATSPVGRHYELARTMDLHMGIVAHVYRRTSDFERADVEYVRDVFDEAYPQWPELFHDRFEAYLARM